MLNIISNYIVFSVNAVSMVPFFGVRIKFQNKFNDVYRVYLEKLESYTDVDSQILDRPEEKQRQGLGLDGKVINTVNRR